MQSEIKFSFIGISYDIIYWLKQEHKMYFTTLPDHTKPGFDEQSHFSKFKKHNIVFNAVTSSAHCDDHVGCLSLKTVLCGEEWYTINNRHFANRPGQFLVLNDDQNYACRIDSGEKVRVLSFFFKKDFASTVFRDTLCSEDHLLDNPLGIGERTPEFFQTLNNIDPELQQQLAAIVTCLDSRGYDSFMIDECLIFLLRYLLKVHKSESAKAAKVNAIKSSTRNEIYRRLCVAKDVLHSLYMENPDLNMISDMACLSVPQLVRQFKLVFHTTPHQYLTLVKLNRAAELLKFSDKPVHEITWQCGFENVSAFSRAFKSAHGIQPLSFRKMN